jgi:hypothetical protein
VSTARTRYELQVAEADDRSESNASILTVLTNLVFAAGAGDQVAPFEAKTELRIVDRQTDETLYRLRDSAYVIRNLAARIDADLDALSADAFCAEWALEEPHAATGDEHA